MLLAHVISTFTSLAFALPIDSKIQSIIDLGYTTYQGYDLPNGITQWLGMRYAAPPLGNLRFRAPQDPVADSNVNVADTVCFTISTRQHTNSLRFIYSTEIYALQPAQLPSQERTQKTACSLISLHPRQQWGPTNCYPFTSSSREVALMRFPIRTIMERG